MRKVKCMNYWRKISITGWIDGWCDRKIRKYNCLAGWLAGWVDGWMVRHKHNWMDEWMDIWCEEKGQIITNWIDEWIDGWTDGQMDEWTNGWKTFNLFKASNKKDFKIVLFWWTSFAANYIETLIRLQEKPPWWKKCKESLPKEGHWGPWQ